jgi:hypothetical protein
MPCPRQVPEVHVTARAFLPSTSLVTFELANGLNFTTFVSTVPISGESNVVVEQLCRVEEEVLAGVAAPPSLQP